MPVPRFEVPVGVIDGLNTTFTVSRPYQPGTTAVFLNGQLKSQLLDDGWVETSPAGGVVDLKEAPLGSPGCEDVVQIFYIDTSPALPETVIDTRLEGVIRTKDELSGEITLEVVLSGTIDDTAVELDGAIEGVGLLQGVVQEVEALDGEIIGVC